MSEESNNRKWKMNRFKWILATVGSLIFSLIMFGEFLPREPTQMEQVIEQVSGVSYSSWIYRVSIGDVLKFLFATILTTICLMKAIRNDP